MTSAPSNRYHRDRGEREPILAGTLLALALLMHLLVSGGPAHAASTDMVISQVYGGGGLAGAPYNQDFVELVNRGSTAVAIDGWSVQYRSPMGSTWSVAIVFAGVQVMPGQRFLLHLGTRGSSGMELPRSDAFGSSGIGAGSGVVALVRSPTPISGCPTPSDHGVADLVGYGNAGCSETAAAPAGSATWAVTRQSAGCVDTDDNQVDFALAEPQPRNSFDSPIQCTTGGAVLTRASTSTAGRAPLTVSLDYGLQHVGTAPISDVVVADDTCAPVMLTGGDADNDGLLEPGETWTYRCSRTFTQAGVYTSTASARGKSSGTNVTSNTAKVTVRVTDPRPALTLTATPTDGRAPLAVSYTYTARNDGSDPLQTVAVGDASCSPVTFTSGEAKVSSTKGGVGVSSRWEHEAPTAWPSGRGWHGRDKRAGRVAVTGRVERPTPPVVERSAMSFSRRSGDTGRRQLKRSYCVGCDLGSQGQGLFAALSDRGTDTEGRHEECAWETSRGRTSVRLPR